MASGIGISQEASRLAFRIGLELDRLLVQRGLEAAAREGLPNVSSDHIESALDRSVCEKLLNTWKESIANDERRTSAETPGKAA